MQTGRLPTLLLSMISLDGASLPSGNLYWGKRLDRISDSVFVLQVDAWEVRYLPCASGNCAHLQALHGHTSLPQDSTMTPVYLYIYRSVDAIVDTT